MTTTIPLPLQTCSEDAFDVILYTNDFGDNLNAGAVPGAVVETDGGLDGFTNRDKQITNPTELGPYLDAEYYIVAPDHWFSPRTGGDIAFQSQGDSARF